MKKIIALVSAMIIAFAVNGQISQPSSDRIKAQDFSCLPSILKHKLDSLISEVWDPIAGTWVNSGRNFYTYDALGNVTTQVNCEWDNDNAVWASKRQLTYLFYDPWHPAVISENHWNPISGNWMPYCKSEFTYNGNWNLTLLLKSCPVGDVGLWQAMSKTEYSYNAGLQLIEQTESLWSSINNQWEYVTKSEFNYDESNLMTMQINADWDFAANEWEQRAKYEMSRDNEGHIVLLIESEWDDNTGEWLPLNKYESTFNSNGDKTAELLLEWSVPAQTWINSALREFVFEADGGMTDLTRFLWELSTMQWTIVDKTEFAFTNAFVFEDLVLPYEYKDDELNFRYMLNDKLYYSFVNNNFIPSYREKYSYAVTNLIGIEEFAVPGFVIFPNPASDCLHITWFGSLDRAEIVISDISGRIVLQSAVQNNADLMIDRFAPGLYLYRLYAGGYAVTQGKFVVR